MGLFKDAPSAPKPIDPGESQGKYLFGKDFENYDGVTDPELQRRLIESEREFRPQYAENNLQDFWNYWEGVGGQEGLGDLQAATAAQASSIGADASSFQRDADIGDVERLGARATEAYRNADPYTQGLLSSQNSLSQDLYNRAQGVTPQQARSADQQAREAFAARGRSNDNAGVAAEILGREEVMRGNRAEAMQAGYQTLQMNQATAADPFASILGRPSGAAQLGGQYAQGAQSLLGTSTPQLFDPDAGVNLALQNNANQANYDSAIYGAQAARTGAIIGGVFGGIGSAFGGG